MERRHTDGLILEAISAINARLLQNDRKFDKFEEKFDKRVDALDVKIDGKIEKIIQNEQSIKTVADKVTTLEKLLDPQNIKQNRYALIAAVLAVLTILQMTWTFLRPLFKHLKLF